MQIVIEIDEEDWKDINDIHFIREDLKFKIGKAIMKGTPLPEHHGRLIECEPIYDKLIRSYRADEKDYPERGKDYRVGLSNAIDILRNAPTIIEGSDNE